MRIPSTLKGEGKKFWTENAPILLDDGRLTPATKYGFMSLCLMWSRYIQAESEGADEIKIVALYKQVQQGMAAYGMTPASRKRLKLDDKKSDLGDILKHALGDDAE